ncbi:MAG: small multi-drug export protein [Clostridia bacterium]|nr:small multi-drug export protein [Clostridia bacterium]
MIPVVELRGAVPVGYAGGLNIWVAVAVSIIGNLLPVPFIIIFIRRIFAFIRRVSPKFNGLISRLEKRAQNKSEVVKKYSFFGLFLLVAIPLPGTGAWTGALVAAMLDMRLKRALPAITAGVFTAGIVVAFLTCGANALFF